MAIGLKEFDPYYRGETKQKWKKHLMTRGYEAKAITIILDAEFCAFIGFGTDYA